MCSSFGSKGEQQKNNTKHNNDPSGKQKEVNKRSYAAVTDKQSYGEHHDGEKNIKHDNMDLEKNKLESDISFLKDRIDKLEKEQGILKNSVDVTIMEKMVEIKKEVESQDKRMDMITANVADANKSIETVKQIENTEFANIRTEVGAAIQEVKHSQEQLANSVASKCELKLSTDIAEILNNFKQTTVNFQQQQKEFTEMREQVALFTDQVHPNANVPFTAPTKQFPSQNLTTTPIFTAPPQADQHWLADQHLGSTEPQMSFDESCSDSEATGEGC